MPRKFDFLSPGIQLTEIDESFLPVETDAEGPIIIGRTQKGPAMKPIKIRNKEDYVSVFGKPVIGGGSSDGDAWREGPQMAAPTYASYAAMAWLSSGNSPVTMVRLLGDQASNASAGGIAGWELSAAVPAGQTFQSTTITINNDLLDQGDKIEITASNFAGQSVYYQFTASVISGATTAGAYFSGDGSISTPYIAQFSGSSSPAAATTKEGYRDALKSLLSLPNGLDSAVFDVANSSTDALVITALTASDSSVLSVSIVETGSTTDGSSSFVSVSGVDSKEENGTAYGLFVVTGATTSTGSLAAIFYCDSGYMTLKGTDGDNNIVNNAGTFVKNVAAGPTFTMNIYDSSGVVQEEQTFNFNRNDGNYIRNVFNRNPRLTNRTLTAEASQKTYWLGESFERHLASNVDTSAGVGQLYAMLLPLHYRAEAGSSLGNWGSWKGKNAAASSGWVFQQYKGASGSIDHTKTAKLFRFISIPEGENVNSEIMIAFDDLKLPNNPAVYNYSSFTIKIMDMNGGVLERFSNLTLDRNSENFVARRLGDMYLDWDSTNRRYRKYGNYVNVSDYVRVEMYDEANENYDQDALPFGFLGPGRPANIRLNTSDGTWANETALSANTTAFAKTGDAASIVGGQPAGETDSMGLGVSGGDFQFEFPKVQMRTSGSDGFVANQYKAVWGIRPKLNSASTIFDIDYCDYVRGLPRNYAAYNVLAAASNGFEPSVQFSLDDIVVDTSTDEVTWAQGKHSTGASYTATSGSAKLLSKGVKRWAMPMFGGFDGIDIKQIEPFGEQTLDTTTSDSKSYANFSLNKAMDTILDSEVAIGNLLLAPGIRTTSFTSRLLSIAETRQDCLAIIDLVGDYLPSYERLPSDTEADKLGSPDEVISGLRTRNLNTSFGCCFFPWVQTSDPLNNNGIVWLPSSIAALGGMAQSEATSDVWFAPAGFNRGGLNELGGQGGPRVLQARQRLDSSERDSLYDVGINPIATFPNEGVVIFGQKTLQQAASALDRINVRRLMIFLKSKIGTVARNLLFDQNVLSTWNRFKGEVEPILEDVTARFGLTDYKLILDETTTTPDLVDRNIMYAKVFLKPARAIEFIAIDFIVTKSGADFA